MPFFCARGGEGCRIQGMKRKRYSVSDGRLVLVLEEAGEGGYVVTSPVNWELITEADSIREAFENARDALKALRGSRKKRDRKKARVL